MIQELFLTYGFDDDVKLSVTLDSLDSTQQVIFKNESKVKAKTLVVGLTFMVHIILGLICVLQTYQSSIFRELFCLYLFNTVMIMYTFKTKTSMNHTNVDFISSLYVITNSILAVCILFQKYAGIWAVSSASLPMEALIYTMSSPVIHVYLFDNLSFQTLLRSWIINVSALLVLSLWHLCFSGHLLTVTMFYVPFSYLILHETHCQRVLSFVELEKCKQEIVCIKDQSQKDIVEMQSMLGNVTHDLKTVSCHPYDYDSTSYSFSTIIKLYFPFLFCQIYSRWQE